MRGVIFERRSVNPTIRKFMLFAIAGGAGFVTDTAVLYLLKGALGPYAARVVSFMVGVLTTWLINRSLALKGQLKDVPLWLGFLNYLGALYAALVATIPLVAEHLILGVAAGVAGGMVVNFLLADKLVFKSRVPPQSV